MLGLYLHRNSPVHRTPAGAKLAMLLITAGIVLVRSEPLVLAAAGLLCAGLTAVARLPPAALAAQLRPLAVLMLPLFTVQAVLAGWHDGLTMVGRFGVLVLLATLVTLTTRVSDMMDTLERLLRPLRPLGVNAGKIGLMLTLAVRFVPVLLDLLREMRLAQQARGGDCNPGALLVPLMVKTLRMADTLAEAVEARGYDPR